MQLTVLLGVEVPRSHPINPWLDLCAEALWVQDVQQVRMLPKDLKEAQCHKGLEDHVGLAGHCCETWRPSGPWGFEAFHPKPQEHAASPGVAQAVGLPDQPRQDTFHRISIRFP